MESGYLKITHEINKKEALISVIVPVYKTQDYLCETVECILKQTYRNLEIILVDDGSPDKCGEICDRYAKADPRIKVIHKENGGLSSARNAGLKNSSGEFISFIDSDDLICEDYYEYLVLMAQIYDSDIAVCCVCDFKDGMQPEYEIGIDHFRTEISKDSALEQFLYQGNIRTGVLGKLFRRNSPFFGELIFPEGIYYEDAWPMYRALLKAQKIAWGSAVKFGYRHRTSAQSKQKFSLKEMTGITEWDRIYEDIKRNYPSMGKAAASRLLSANFHILLMIPKGENQKELLQCWENIKKYRRTVIFDRNARKKARMAAIISLLGLRVMQNIGDKVFQRGRK